MPITRPKRYGVADYYKMLQRSAPGPYRSRGLSYAGIAGAGLAGAASYYYNKYRNSTPQPVVSKAAASKMTARQKKAIKKRGGFVPKVPKSLKAQVKDLAKAVKASNGILIYRKRGTARCLAAVNQQTLTATEAIIMNNYEVVLAQLRFFNPSSPGTLIQGSGATGTYYRDYLFKTVHTNLTIRNNYQIPAKVTVYVCVPKEDTSIAPDTAFTNGLADVGNPSSSSPLVYLTDSDEFNDLWKIQSSKSKLLLPGVQFHVSYSNNNISYSPATIDSHSLSYQKRFGSYVILVRCEGIIAHDSSADQQGMAQAGVDLTWDTTYKVEYDAGVDLKYIYLDDLSDTFTNGALVSSMPVSDNIGYSVS